MSETRTPDALTIRMRPVAELVPYARNARKHPEKQIAQIAGSIAAFGFNNPVLVDADDRIIAGHGRVLAAQKLGLEQVPTILIDHLSENERRAFILADNRIAENAAWDAELLGLEMADLSELGFERRSHIIWVKQHFAISRGHYHWAHEPCWYAVRQGKSGHWLGDRKQSTVWEVPNASAFGGDREDGKTIHSTQKPVEVMRRPILNHTKPGEAVYDPFLGSGTTTIAAENTKRRAFGLEIEPRYVDVIVRRWETFVGSEATLDGDGRSFEAIAADRAVESAG